VFTIVQYLSSALHLNGLCLDNRNCLLLSRVCNLLLPLDHRPWLLGVHNLLLPRGHHLHHLLLTRVCDQHLWLARLSINHLWLARLSINHLLLDDHNILWGSTYGGIPTKHRIEVAAVTRKTHLRADAPLGFVYCTRRAATLHENARILIRRHGGREEIDVSVVKRELPSEATRYARGVDRWLDVMVPTLPPPTLRCFFRYQTQSSSLNRTKY
jgi:hypothetical protein